MTAKSRRGCRSYESNTFQKIVYDLIEFRRVLVGDEMISGKDHQPGV